MALRREPNINSEFGLRKVEVSSKESPTFVYGKSKARKWPKKGSLWLPEILVNNVYFRWKKRTVLELTSNYLFVFITPNSTLYFPT